MKKKIILTYTLGIIALLSFPSGGVRGEFYLGTEVDSPENSKYMTSQEYLKDNGLVFMNNDGRLFPGEKRFEDRSWQPFSGQNILLRNGSEDDFEDDGGTNPGGGFVYGETLPVDDEISFLLLSGGLFALLYAMKFRRNFRKYKEEGNKRIN